jgi:hypothetical protein
VSVANRGSLSVAEEIQGMLSSKQNLNILSISAAGPQSVVESRVALSGFYLGEAEGDIKVYIKSHQPEESDVVSQNGLNEDNLSYGVENFDFESVVKLTMICLLLVIVGAL